MIPVGASVGSTIYDEVIAVTGAGGSPPPPALMTGTFSTAARGATSFEVYAEFDCAAVGNQQAQQIAEKALSMSEPWQVERALLDGRGWGSTCGVATLGTQRESCRRWRDHAAIRSGECWRDRCWQSVRQR